jgi:hypothetical protein
LEQFDYIRDGLYFNFDFRYGALLGTQVHHRNVLGIVAGIAKLGERVGERVAKKYEAQIVIFRILLAVNRFSWISRKVESH